MPDEGGQAVGARTFRITPFGRGRRLVPGVGFRSKRVLQGNLSRARDSETSTCCSRPGE